MPIFAAEMREHKDKLLGLLRDRQEMSLRQQARLTMLLSMPAILAQLSSVMMQYIDAAMVGHLGANPSAAIGLVSSSTWIINGFAMACSSGFTVQIAHLCGAKDFAGARGVMRQGLLSLFLFTLCLTAFSIAVSGPLPHWLGGSPEICHDASRYFLICMAFLPISSVGWSSSIMLQASGNMKTPSIIFISMGALDVLLNYLFIYLLGMGVAGAALGTGLAELICSVWSVAYLFLRSKELNIRHERGSFLPRRATLHKAIGISAPMMLQNVVMRGAYVASTLIIAPLGAVSIAANTFAIIAESFCYMPGQGVSEAATTLIGQSLGAGRKDTARRFGWISIGIAAGMMSLLAVLMYAFSPGIMRLITSDPAVASLGARVLRLEAFAETMYACSIVGYGIFVGAGDTLAPSIINFFSMWAVRIVLAVLLTPKFGLMGYWIAMCVELNVRGLLFLLRLRGGRWLRRNLAKA